MHLALRHKINGAIIVTFIVIALLFTLIQLPFQRHQLQRTIDRIEELLHTLVERDTEQLANEIFDARLTAIKLRIHEMCKVEGILGISIFDHDGKRLVSNGSVLTHRDISADQIKKIRQHSVLQKLDWEGRGALLFSKEISFLGEQLGFIRIHYSLETVEKDQSTTFWIVGCLLGTILVVMMVVLNLILSKAILHPIMYLRKATQSIVQGNLENEISLPREDELGNLATSFDQMRCAIKEKISDLQRITDTYRQLYQYAPVMLHTVDPQGRIIEVNDLWLTTMGFEKKEVIGRHALDYLTENSKQNTSCGILPQVYLEGSVKDEACQLKTKNGAVVDVLLSAFPQLNFQGNIVRSTVSIQDITALKKAENALRESEKQLRLITDNMVDIISRTDPQIKLIYISPSVERVFGYSPQEISGKSALDFIHPDDADGILKQAAEARQQKAAEILVQYRWRHANGTYIWVESATRLLYDDQGQSKGAVFGTRDINARKQAEEAREKLEKQLLQTQKLEAIGQLAGGVAHDLNNLLSPILGYTELLLEEETNPDKGKEMLEQIYKASIGARDLVRQLLAFSRKQTLEYKPLDINKVLTDFELLLRRTIVESIKIVILRSSNIKPIMADAGQIEQMILNLAINAADAMPKGGTLTIETDLVNLDEVYAATHPDVKPGTYVMLGISDTGNGMDEKTQEHIFDPFFSTKGQQGTGLGLATVYGITKQHNGSIWVYSELGRGTTFKIYLPTSETIPSETQSNYKNLRKLRGAETILVVEDNEQVRNIVSNILESQGYKVLAAKNGKEALRIMASEEEKVPLLLTDVVMPEMNGRDLYAKLVQDHPGLKVIYMSGYTNNIIAHHGVLDDGLQFIQKPFTIHSIASKVREVLDQ